MKTVSAIAIISIIRWSNAADVCVNVANHKDVNSAVAAAIAEPNLDNKECLTHCLKLKDTMPCNSAVYAATLQPIRGLCKLYTDKMSANLVEVIGISSADATYYEWMDPCSSESVKLSVDNNGNVVDIPTGTTTTTQSISSTDPTSGSPGTEPELTTESTSTLPFRPFPPQSPPPTALPPPPSTTDGGSGGAGTTEGPGPGSGGTGGGSYLPPGQWGQWNDWTTCSVTCGGSGVQKRTRPCSGTGKTCSGNGQESKTCLINDQPCAVSTTASRTDHPPTFRPFMPVTVAWKPFLPKQS